MKPTLSSPYTRSILKILQNLGFDTRQGAIQVGIDASRLTDLKYRIEAEKISHLFENAAQALGEPNIGLETGHRFRVHAFMETGKILAYTSTVAEGVQVNADYQALVDCAGVCALERRDGGTFMTWEPNQIDDCKHRHIVDLVVTGYAATTQWLAWSISQELNLTSGLSHAGFRHEKPENAERFEEIFQCPVSFGCETNFIQFADGVADYPLPSHNPEKLAQMRAHLDPILENVKSSLALTANIDEAILAALNEEKLTEDYIRNHVGLSETDFRRALKSNGWTLRDLVDQKRKTLSVEYINQGHKLTETAQMLGYSDQPAFTKAFKRWYGCPPSKYNFE